MTITAVWANTGEDKVTRDELRTVTKKRPVINSAWNGTTVNVFSAKNEVVGFCVYLENATEATASEVSVRFNNLKSQEGAVIGSAPDATRKDIFNWTRRDIELFLVGYLQIKGTSQLSYGTYDERHVPTRLRLPAGKTRWADRPDHDKFYPDIAYPMELFPRFPVGPKRTQGVWVDIYVPKDIPPGAYTGEFEVLVVGAVVKKIPVKLTVRKFQLPDTPSCKTMLYSAHEDVAERYFGEPYPNAGTIEATKTEIVIERQFMLAHRHKISMINANEGPEPWTQDKPRPEWEKWLDGSAFVDARGYRGPGEGIGNNIFSIGTYGAWQGWWDENVSGRLRRAKQQRPMRHFPTHVLKSNLQKHVDANRAIDLGNGHSVVVKLKAVSPSKLVQMATKWEAWFKMNFPNTERFLYLIDESEDYPQTEGWAKALLGKIKTFATASLLKIQSDVPSLSIAVSWMALGEREKCEGALAARKAARQQTYMYNGMRPGTGSFATEDDGVALRSLAWAQAKKGIDRWFFWSATYYNDYQGGRGHTDVFRTAATFAGTNLNRDPSTGETAWNYSNGDGVLFYPGTDFQVPERSKRLLGPLASLRLKHWRRGIQDVDYIALAAVIDPTATAAIVERIVPKVLWDNDVADPSDPTFVHAPISWSTNPDVWEKARLELANIIERR